MTSRKECFLTNKRVNHDQICSYYKKTNHHESSCYFKKEKGILSKPIKFKSNESKRTFNTNHQGPKLLWVSKKLLISYAGMSSDNQ